MADPLVLKDGTQAPFSLSQAAQYDFENKAKEKLTGWGSICKILASKKATQRESK
jgi:hypothetical protein